MTLSSQDHAIWTAMGLGPVWTVRSSVAGSASADTADAVEAQMSDSAASAAVALRQAIAWVGDFDIETSAAGHVLPCGVAGDLLLNMLKAAGLKPDVQVFVSTRGMPPSAVLHAVAQSRCVRAVLLGVDMAGSSAPAVAAEPEVFHLQCATHTLEAARIDSLADMLAQPTRKAQAWRGLCLIRDRFALPR